ncbi:F-box/LRR-repeat protein 2 [Frankliniella fusca]|uniref:F-box/LRR-repeat protein 2 n=1 Tax=Frankliniella fusca TaxID=407009 RepID=A0AAE1GX46_9NEOP|nr:F-box/LRR-repeat protein 2 [Frankliniella fusca]
MPLRNEPPSLRKVAMTVICDHFEPLCYGYSAEQVANMIDTEEYLDIKGPFEDMPPLLVEEMSEEMKHVTHLRRHHLHLLTTPRVTSWTLHGVADQRLGLDFLAARSKNLKHLNLSYLRHINPHVLCNLIPSFSTLVTLNLRMTLAVDPLLAQIGRHCPALRELNLAGTPVTDRGLVQLCISTEGRRQCQRLSKLVVSETCVSVSGAAVVLQSLPSLTDFDFDNIFEAVDMVEQWDRALEARLLTPAGVRLSEQPVAPPDVLQLRALTSGVEFVGLDSLDSAVKMCPFAASISISGSWLPNEALYKFMVLESLTALSLSNGEGMTLDFQEGVLPLLSACGERLQNLILTNFTEVDLAGIGRTCPRLLNLALSAVGHYEPLSSVNTSWFSQLQALEVWADTSQAHAQGHEQLPSALHLRQLLVSPSLKNILFTACAALNDQLFHQIWMSNPMKLLSHLTLDHCHGVSPHLVHQVLDADNELTMLRIWSCCQINKIHNGEFVARICEENMNVYLEWFACND